MSHNVTKKEVIDTSHLYIYKICLNSPERGKVVNVNETNTWFEAIIID